MDESSGGKIVNVILSSGGTIKDPSSNDPQYVGPIVNKMQTVSTSMDVADFIKAVHVSFNLDPRKRYKVYSRVYLTPGVSVFVDISYSSTLADLVVNDPNGLNSVFRFCTEEIVAAEEGPPNSDGNVTTNGSRCSFKDSNGPMTHNQNSQNQMIHVGRISSTPVNVAHDLGDSDPIAQLLCTNDVYFPGPSSPVVPQPHLNHGRLLSENPDQTNRSLGARGSEVRGASSCVEDPLPASRLDITSEFGVSKGSEMGGTSRCVIIPDVCNGIDTSFLDFGYEFPMDEMPVIRVVNADADGYISPTEWEDCIEGNEIQSDDDVLEYRTKIVPTDPVLVMGTGGTSVVLDDTSSLRVTLAGDPPLLSTLSNDSTLLPTGEVVTRVLSNSTRLSTTGSSGLGSIVTSNPDMLPSTESSELVIGHGDNLVVIPSSNLIPSTNNGSSDSLAVIPSVSTVGVKRNRSDSLRRHGKIQVDESNEADDYTVDPDDDDLVSLDPSQIYGTGTGVTPSSFSDLHVGMLFPNRQKLFDTLAGVHVKGLREYISLKTAPERFTAKCKNSSSGCSWFIHATKVGTFDTFQIIKYDQEHSCSVHCRHGGTGHKHASAKWIASLLCPFVLDNKDITATFVQTFMKEVHHIDISEQKAGRARIHALELVHGSFKESFSILPKLVKEMEKLNDGTVTNLARNQNGMFAAIFWAFGPAIKTFRENLRPVIAVDGTHLRGEYPGILLVACAQDGDNGVVPIAYAIVESEKKDCCIWFLNLLWLHVIDGYKRINELVVISDKGGGLVAAMDVVMPNVKHVNCVRHFLENFYTTFNDATVREFMWIAATTALPRNFEYHMGEIRKASPRCAEWLDKFDKALWTQAFLFPLKRWGIFTTNMCESTNAQLRVARSYPVAALVQATRAKAALYFAKRHDRSFTRTKSITRYASKKLVKVVNKTKQCIPTSYGNNKFSVDHLGELYSVDLTLRTCSCLQFQSVGIPCIHACSSIMRMGLDLADYCHDWYSMDNYRRTYAVTFAPCEGYSRWPYDPTSEYIIPPIWKRNGGRRKKRKRIESQSVVRFTVRCSTCQEMGHNKRSCDTPPVPRPTRM